MSVNRQFQFSVDGGPVQTAEVEIGFEITLADPQAQILAELADPKIRQRDIASTYGLALRSADLVDWHVVNTAIIGRWSVSGLKRIKAEAWNRHQQWLAGAAS